MLAFATTSVLPPVFQWGETQSRSVVLCHPSCPLGSTDVVNSLFHWCPPPLHCWVFSHHAKTVRTGTAWALLMGLALAHTNATAVFEFMFARKTAIRQMFGRTVQCWVTEKESKCVHLDHGRNLHSKSFSILCCPSQGSNWSENIFYCLFIAWFAVNIGALHLLHNWMAD